jgi:hypothetical protein
MGCDRLSDRIFGKCSWIAEIGETSLFAISTQGVVFTLNKKLHLVVFGVDD